MKKLRITIENKSYEVTVEDLTGPDSFPPGVSPNPAPSAVTPAMDVRGPQPAKPNLPIDAGAVTSPMAGVIKSVLVKVSDQVKQGQPLVVLEAMKMENQITAPVAGTVKRIEVAEAESVQEGQVLLVLE